MRSLSDRSHMTLRGRAIHSDIERLRQVGILRRRLSRRQELRVLLPMSMTPLSRRIAH